MKEFLLGFWKDEDGVQTIEMVIILVVVVGLAFAFRETLMNWYEAFFEQEFKVGSPNLPKPNR